MFSPRKLYRALFRLRSSPGTVTLYTRPGCGLCEEMKRELENRGYGVETVDISADRELKRKWGLEIPVAVLDGKVLAKGRLE